MFKYSDVVTDLFLKLPAVPTSLKPAPKDLWVWTSAHPYFSRLEFGIPVLDTSQTLPTHFLDNSMATSRKPAPRTCGFGH